jgi:hypothetical protein
MRNPVKLFPGLQEQQRALLIVTHFYTCAVSVLSDKTGRMHIYRGQLDITLHKRQEPRWFGFNSCSCSGHSHVSSAPLIQCQNYQVSIYRVLHERSSFSFLVKKVKLSLYLAN